VAAGDIYELKCYQDYGSNVRQCLNVYYFVQTASNGNSAGLRRAFLQNIDINVRAWQSLVMRTSFIETRNLFNVSDFEAVDVTGDDLLGAVNASALPVHDAVTFRLIRTTREINNGYKRYAGLPETSVDNGFITDAGTIVLLEVLRTDLVAPIEDPDNESDLWSQVILKRIRHEPDAEHTKVWYTLPLTPEDAFFSNPASALVNLFVRHQVSRQVG